MIFLDDNMLTPKPRTQWIEVKDEITVRRLNGFEDITYLVHVFERDHNIDNLLKIIETSLLEVSDL